MQPSAVSEPAANPEETPSQPSFRWLRYAAIAGVCLLLAWPVVYLVVRRATGYAGRAGRRAAAAHDAIARLGATARAHSGEAQRLRLAWDYLNNNEAGRAIPVLRSVLAEDQKNADAWNDLCFAYTQTMRYNLAVADCRHALRVEPGYPVARNNLSVAVSKMRETGKMISAEKRTAPSARDATFYVDEGLNFLHVGRYQQAIRAWQQALALHPRDARAANDIGVAYMFLRRPAQAVEWFQKAISFDPGLQLARNNLAWGRRELKKPAGNSR